MEPPPVAIPLRRKATRRKRRSPKPVEKLAKGAFVKTAISVLDQAKGRAIPTKELRARMEERLGGTIRSEGFGSLVRYGYAKLTKDGYLATGKAWGA